MEEVMRCPNLVKWVVFICKAVDNTYVPSNFELEEYCKTKSHRKCPFYAGNAEARKARACYVQQ
ncbi:MAG: hypothetical protein OHK0032_16910 [Thermodesulfovibrionales bacterium]